MDRWVYGRRAGLNFIRPGKPVENAHIESFNGRLGDECLNVEFFFKMDDVQRKLDEWREDYNNLRPNSVLADLASREFVQGTVKRRTEPKSGGLQTGVR